MLVLSRRLGDKILFPDLEITVEILQANGKTVRVGIQAPPDVAVLRHELAGSAERSLPPTRKSENTHRLRNRLNGVRLALFLLEQQLNAGMTDAASTTLSRAL